ncbi:MAG: lamin tail domain-containing protein [Patescibacteria group bacterium]
MLNRPTLAGILCASLVFVGSNAAALFISNTVTLQSTTITVGSITPPPPPPSGTPQVRLFALADNELQQKNPQKNLGTHDEANVTSKVGRNTHLIARFDLAALPPGSTLTSCQLGLYMNQAPSFESRQHGAFRLSTNETTWNEGLQMNSTALPTESSWQWFARPSAWTTAGGDMALLPTATIQTGLIDGVWQAWDVSSDCSAQALRSWGIRDLASNSALDRTAEYETRESDSYDKRPYLGVDFTSGPFTTNHIVINEVFTATTSATHGNSRDNEWVELYNPTGAAVNLAGWQLCETEDCTSIPAGTTIAAQGYLVLTSHASTWQHWTIPVASQVVLGERIGGDNMDDDGDRVILKNAAGTTIDAMSYEEDTSVFNPSVPGADRDWSMQRVVAGYDTDQATNFWTNPTPTPGL